MKHVRYVVLLSLVVLLLASCAGLPPVFPNRAPSPEDVEEVGVVEESTVEAPAAAEQPAVEPAAPVTETAVVTTTTTITATEVVTTTAPAGAPTGQAEEQVMGANPLVGVVWEWAALLKTSPAVQSVVPDPTSYTVIFADDGNLLIKADCNSANGTYTLADDQLVIAVGAVTRAACPPGSLGDLMLTSLGQVGSYLIDGGDLILRLAETGDSMLFRNGGPAAVPAAPPTTEAPAAAAPAGTPAPAEATAQSPSLTGPVWQWERFVDVATGQNTMDVPNPEDYAATFNEDGSVAMKADCNQAAGEYTVDGAALTVTIGPVTLAACGPQSLGEMFLINLTSAATYSIEDGKLLIDLMADGGRMVFGAAE